MNTATPHSILYGEHSRHREHQLAAEHRNVEYFFSNWRSWSGTNRWFVRAKDLIIPGVTQVEAPEQSVKNAMIELKKDLTPLHEATFLEFNPTPAIFETEGEFIRVSCDPAALSAVRKLYGVEQQCSWRFSAALSSHLILLNELSGEKVGAVLLD